MLRKYFTLYVLLISASFVRAQEGSSSYSAVGRGGVATTFVTDYRAIGVNPANLGLNQSHRDPKITFGFFEINSTFFSGAFSRKQLFDAASNSNANQFSMQEKIDASKNVTGKDFAVNVDAILFGINFRMKKNKGFAFSIRDGIQLYSKLNQNASEIAFLGKNASYFEALLGSDGRLYANPLHPNPDPNLAPLPADQVGKELKGSFYNKESASFYSDILDGTRISNSWFREYNLSYGMQLFESYDLQVFGGLGVRYLSGIVYIDLQAKNGDLVNKHISVSPSFGLDFGETNGDTPQAPTFQAPENTSAFEQFANPRPIGGGWGVDLGLTMIIKRNFYVGASVNNIGSITWDGNVYKVSDGKLVEFQGTGFNSYNILGAEAGALQFAGDKSPFQWEGTDKIVVDLPSTIRIGASYKYYSTLHAGIDIILPRNNVAGNLDKPLFAIGADYRPFKLFRISTGLNAGGNNGDKINLPAGVTYIGRKGLYEAGIATKDLITYVADLGQGSTVSLAVGFLRFHIL